MAGNSNDAPQSETLQDLSGAAEQRAAALSQAYQLFAQALTYPDKEYTQWLREGNLAQGLRSTLEAVEPDLAESNAAWPTLSYAGSADELAIEYTRLFDAGASGPPCPLYGGLYGNARMKTMEEAVRFYNHFGLTLSEEQRELPDHLATQLEFLHFLCYREAEALQQGTDAGSYQRAQRDFLKRHPGAWIPQLRTRLEKEDAAPFFANLFALLGDLLAVETTRLAALPQSTPQ